MNILVTGAAGFIGSHLCESLINTGNRVIGIDNFDDYYPARQKWLNLSYLAKENGFRFYEADIRINETLRKILQKEKIDIVVHLAAKAGVRPSIEQITDYYDVNINGTLSLLEAMRLNDVKKMIFASSSSVYGNSLRTPFKESDTVDNPISPYASTKKSGELLCHVYYHLYKFDITCLRFFTVYGPRQRPDLAIHKFTHMIDTGQPIPFYGDGTTARDYTYIDDILQGIRCALDYLHGFHIYNLGESRLTDLQTLVTILEKTLGKPATIEKLPMQPGDVVLTYADISKAKAEIGYNPVHDFETGVAHFVDWYQKNKDHIY